MRYCEQRLYNDTPPFAFSSAHTFYNHIVFECTYFSLLKVIITWLQFNLHMIGLKLIKRFWLFAISSSRLKIDPGRCPESEVKFLRPFKLNWSSVFFYSLCKKCIESSSHSVHINTFLHALVDAHIFNCSTTFSGCGCI